MKNWIVARAGVTLVFVLLSLPGVNQAGAATCRVEPAGTWVEAENYTAKDNNWSNKETSQPDAYSGSGYLRALIGDRTFPPQGSGAEYLLAFDTPGTYYLIVRGHNERSNARNEMWYGVRPKGATLDYDAHVSGDLAIDRDRSWDWDKNRQSAGYPDPIRIDIPVIGEYIVHFWSREAGFQFDGFTLSTSNQSTPNDNTLNPNWATSVDPTDTSCGGIVIPDPRDVDDDNDGVTENQGDCDDNPLTGSQRSPLLSERCGDGIDNDCDAATVDVCPVDADNDGVFEDLDCDDADSSNYPGNTEICIDGQDNDCDGLADNADTQCDLDGDNYSTEAGDCFDDIPSAYPGATELCDGIDNDCDGAIDNNCTTGGATTINTGGIAQVPLFITQAAKPLVMLNLSNDHQLYFPAYSSYDDVDGDGSPNTSYTHSYNYYGYFDPYKCYDYDTTDNRFEPVSMATGKYCDALGGGEWSGNFLNWVSMGRIDSVRKIMYGGYRSLDTSSDTTLQRSYLPNDAHSWVKYYKGDDIAKLTPFTTSGQGPVGSSATSNSVGLGSKTFLTSFTSSQVEVGDQVRITRPLISSDYMLGTVTAFDVTGSMTVEVSDAVGSQTYTKWEIVNLTRSGISVCNTTYANSGYSQDITAPPLMRFAEGNYELWTANEKYQCRWHEEVGNSGQRINHNDVGLTGMTANRFIPVKADVGMGLVDYRAEVQACVSGLLGTEKCKRYTGGNYKPIGLLQQYGDTEELYFGLMTGSYLHNMSGGVLRKNISAMLDEIDATDGTFATVPSTGSIINTLNLLRIVGYNHSNGGYTDSTGSGGDGCAYVKDSWSDGSCTNWGNPQSEIYLESLRYFGGKSANPDFNVTGNDRLTGLTSATWSDPLSSANYCAPLNIINFNASVASFDGNQLGGSSDITSTSVSALTDVVGAGENIHGNDWFVGENGTDNNQICTSKTVNSLGSVEGTCPEAPKSDGSFAIAGLAHYAYTNDLRTTGNSNDLQDEQTIKTFGVALAPAVPKIEVPMPGQSTPVVTILPACREKRLNPVGSCSIVNFKIIEQNISAGTGSFYIQWEAAESGGDYDQDMDGILSYSIDPIAKEIEITTDVLHLSAGMESAFGYVTSGTGADGFHAHSGANSYDYSDPTGKPGCNNCNTNDAPTSATYLITGNSSGLLEQPLYYAAKWSGYNKEVAFPSNSISWDEDSDGQPDNYFFATDPSKLDANLNEVFLDLAKVASSAAAVASNSTSLDTDTLIYQARFNSGDWYGELLAFHVSTTDGAVGSLAWDAESVLPAPASRKIFTYDPNAATKGRLFTSGGLTTDLQTMLDVNFTGTNDGLGSDRLGFLRGDRTNELQQGGVLRDRTRILGDIINSDPFYLGTPDFRYHKLSPEGASYTTYQQTSTYQNRRPMIFVGANDGMLHCFDGELGNEIFAYVPYTVFPNLSRLTSPSYGTSNLNHMYYVNGSPRAGDVYYNSAWHSVVVGSLGGGGKGIFALDVTDPSTFGVNNVLWEVNSSTTGFADLGFTLLQPSIVRLANGQWAAIFGNGYSSSAGKAVFYIVNIQDGSIIKTIELDAGPNNGLSDPLPIDDDGDRIVDYVYAGDLKGNVWKIDLDTSNVNQWGSAYKSGSTPIPLFTAVGPNGEVQPITARPEAGRNPAGGVMVYFGTGSFYKNGDNVLPATQAAREVETFYGIHDNGGVVNSDRSELVSQIISSEQTVTNASGDVNVRIVSNNAVAYSNTVKGWYMDLVSPVNGREGERVVTKPLLRHGRVIFATLMPSDHSCEFGGSSWLMEVDAMSGGRLDMNVFDINGDGVINSSDVVTVSSVDAGGNTVTTTIPATGRQSTEGIIQTPGTVLKKQSTNMEYKYATGSSGNITVISEQGGDQSNTGRRSWRQLFQ